jgi:hypothetical protein
VASLILEMGLLSLIQVIFLFGGIAVVSGVFWLYFVVPAEKRDRLAGNIPVS